MGLISNALGFSALSLEDPAQPLMPVSALTESLGLGRSDSGVLVNPTQAMRYSTVFSCVRVISEDLSRLSLDIFQQMPDGSLKLSTTHKNYYVLHDRPNENMSSLTWRRKALTDVCMFGNAYTWIKRDNAARVVALVPLSAAKTSAVAKNGVFMYATTQTDNGHVAHIDPADVLHFHGPTLDGISGLSPLSLRNMIGLGIAAEKFGAQFFGNGARATGIFTHPETLDPEAYEVLKKSLHEAVTGENANRPLILEEGMQYKQLSIPPNDAQFIETRKFTKEEIAQCFRVPLHLLQDLARATNANLEFQGTEYVRHCLMPYACQIEAEIKFKILGKGPFIIEHNFQDLQRGDFPSQTTAFLALRNGGVYSANDVLRGLRQNPIPADEGGDIRIVQGAFVALDTLLGNRSGTDDTDKAKPDDIDPSEGSPASFQRQGFINSYRPLFRDAVGRSIHRNNDAAFVRKAFQPVVNSLCQAFLAIKYGDAQLTPTDEAKITAHLNGIVAGAASWSTTEAAAIATALTESCFDAFSQEIN